MRTPWDIGLSSMKIPLKSPLGQWDFRTVLLVAAAVPFLTYTVTSLKHLLAVDRAKRNPEGAEPPGVPYAIPILGNAYAFGKDPAGFLTALRCVN
jgi:hypothetical protein